MKKEINKIILKGNQIISAYIQVVFYKEADYIVAQCPALNLATDAKTIEKAKEMFKEAFDCWLLSVNDAGDARKTLAVLGWKLSNVQAVVAVKQSNKAQLENNFIIINSPTPAWAA